MFCKYSDIFGKVGESIHSYRVLGIAAIDFIMTIIVSYLLKNIFFKNYEYYEVFIGIFLLGIIFHRLFCVRTTIDKILFP